MSEVITAREIKVLEFDRVRRMLAACTVCPMAEKKALELMPSGQYSEVEIKLRFTSEGRLICSRNAFSPSTVVDIEPLLGRAEKGSMLSGPELASVNQFIKGVRRWQTFFKDRDNREMYPFLNGLAGRLDDCRQLFSALQKSLDTEGSVLDGASPELLSLRRKKHSLQNRIKDRLDEYLRSTHYRRYLQEALVTIRGGRYVLPVKQEYRQHLNGIVHDQSASGATVFIEPLPVVEMQNALASIDRREEEEINRILFQLSGLVVEAAFELSENRFVYGELDLVIARGCLSYEHRCSVPLLLENNLTRLLFLSAVHPLLSGEKVPLDVEIGDPIRTLVVTGPNTGGKTVSLKTIGLLTVMAQCGLHIPAGKESSITVFNRIRADIGDEQSIAQSLSTFSGHMQNIITVVGEAGPDTLVLFDELGAGTDPSEGAALAMAILDTLTTKGALTVATTHINELKLFAQAREKMQNAAMEFDLSTLAPTYRLMQGVPGQSNAFHIAGQLGLAPAVLEKARGYLHRSHDQVESIIAGLVEDRQKFSRDSRRAELDRNRAELILSELEKEKSLLRARREDIIKEAREEARDLVKKAKSETDQVIRELRALKNNGHEKPVAEAEKIRLRLSELRHIHEPEEEKVEGCALEDKDVVVGKKVYLPGLNQKGEIISVSGNEVVVQVGMMKVNVSVGDLRLLPGQEQSADRDSGRKHGGYSVEKEPVFSSSLDLRGLTFEESLPLVEKLFDNCLWAGLKKVELIHGKGTGKLKQGLRDYLKHNRLVSSFRSGESAEGGDGVTIVDLNQH